MYSWAWAATPKHHRLRGLQQRKFTFSQFWSIEVQYQDVSRFSFFWGRSPWPADGHFLAVYSHGCPCLFFLSFLFVRLFYLFFLCVCVFITCSYKDTRPFGLGPTHVASFYLNYHFKGPISKYITFWGTTTYRFGRDILQPKYQWGTCSVQGTPYHQGYRKTRCCPREPGGREGRQAFNTGLYTNKNFVINHTSAKCYKEECEVGEGCRKMSGGGDTL